MTDDQPLSEAWEAAARDWVEWGRKPGHDSYWRFHKEPFFALLPPPGKLTIDIGCGEGRVARDLKAVGHNVVAVDVSPTMVEYAKTADPSMKVLVADAAHLPFDDGAADLAIAFMSLQDVDDMPGAIHEAGRVVERGGAFCLSIVHPINSAGRFESLDADARFVIDKSYLEAHRYRDSIERDGLRMTFNSLHWPLGAYFRALQGGGFVIEALTEPTEDAESVAERAARARWRRLPLFLDLRARKG
jgi:SAM-dependent methyltransferase